MHLAIRLDDIESMQVKRHGVNVFQFHVPKKHYYSAQVLIAKLLMYILSQGKINISPPPKKSGVKR